MYVYNFVSYNINYNYNQLGLAKYLMIAVVVAPVNISFRMCFYCCCCLSDIFTNHYR